MPALDLDTQLSTATDTDLDADLAAERAHLTTSRAALGRMRERAESLFATGDQVAGDAYAAETLGRTLARRVAELADDPTTPLFFGRLDFAGAPTAAPLTAQHQPQATQRTTSDRATASRPANGPTAPSQR